ncbi:MAG: methionyl-tRNA formyltransferase [Anaeromyxobacter sp.]
MRVVYMGTPAFAVPGLDALAAAGHALVAVVAQPDRPAGRGQALRPPPTKVWATGHGVPVLQPEKVRDGKLAAELAALRPDVLAVAAYGRILGRDLLELAPLGAVNVHGSLLPRWRGAAPIQWSVASGEAETGISIMQMDEGLDTGHVILQRVERIQPNDTSETLSERLADLGGRALVEGLALLSSGRAVPVKQDDARATRARPLEKEDGRVDFTRGADAVANRLRAFTPWPGAFTTLGGKLLKLVEARPASPAGLPAGAAPGFAAAVPGQGLLVACGGGTALLVSRVQPEGKAAVAAADFANGLRVRTLAMGT